MDIETIQAIRSANAEIKAFLTHTSSVQTFSEPQGPIPDLKPVAEALDRVSQSLTGLPIPEGADALSQAEVAEYRENLGRLKELLQNMQSQFSDRRQAIATHLGKIQKALGWITSFNQTR